MKVNYEPNPSSAIIIKRKKGLSVSNQQLKVNIFCWALFDPFTFEDSMKEGAQLMKEIIIHERPSRRMKTKRSPLEASGSLVHVLLLRELQGDWFVKELTVNLPAIMMKEKQEMLEGYCS